MQKAQHPQSLSSDVGLTLELPFASENVFLHVPPLTQLTFQSLPGSLDALNTLELANQTLYFRRRFRREVVAWCLLAAKLLEVETEDISA